MQATKYPVAESSCQVIGAHCDLWDAARAAPAGREAPLVLIEEHLTDSYSQSVEEYRRTSVSTGLLDGWSSPSSGVDLGCNEFGGNYVVKVQAFDVGGYELTCRSLDLGKLGQMLQADRRFGRRDRPEELDRLNVEKAAQRAKRKVRCLVKNMGASHLVTFTRRETEATGFATADQWGVWWDRLRRMVVKAKGEFPYVAVLEKHKKGNYHLHVAWVEAPGQKVNLNLVRGCWWAVLGGRGSGNVDAQYIKVRAGLERSDRIAKYVTKYVTKHFTEDSRFNKKRYWASRQSMPEVRRYISNARSISDALAQVQKGYGINLADYMRLGRRGMEYDGFFPFPDGSGFWLCYIPEKHGGAPPPF